MPVEIKTTTYFERLDGFSKVQTKLIEDYSHFSNNPDYVLVENERYENILHIDNLHYLGSYPHKKFTIKSIIPVGVWKIKYKQNDKNR